MKLTPQTIVEKIESVIESRILYYLALLFFLGFSTPQFAEFIKDISRLAGFTDSAKWNHGLIYAIGIESGVFLLAVAGKSKAAKAFAIIAGVCHLLYFRRWDELLLLETWNDPLTLSKAITNLLGSIIISGMTSFSIWYFSELIKEKRDELRTNKNITELKQKETDLLLKVTALQTEERDASRAITALNKKRSEINEDVTELEEKRESIKQEITRLQRAKGGAAGSKTGKQLTTT